MYKCTYGKDDCKKEIVWSSNPRPALRVSPSPLVFYRFYFPLLIVSFIHVTIFLSFISLSLFACFPIMFLPVFSCFPLFCCFTSILCFLLIVVSEDQPLYSALYRHDLGLEDQPLYCALYRHDQGLEDQPLYSALYRHDLGLYFWFGYVGVMFLYCVSII